MAAKKILFISQEIMPYLPETELSNIGRYLPQGIQERGKEIRTFMPRYGCINERRNQLHEVIRLSGMNLIIDDTDRQLIIKVASIQAARMQIYFIDNEDYFHRKEIVEDKDGKVFEDNDERQLFFARGVFETVRKLNWSPDLIYCQGWFTSFVPLILKKEYHDDPLFANTKVIYSACNDNFEGEIDKRCVEKLVNSNISEKDVEILKDPTFVNINKVAIDFSDGVIINHTDVLDEVKTYATESKKPVTTYCTKETYIDNYNSFFDQVLES